jgi:hypothetical protein
VHGNLSQALFSPAETEWCAYAGGRWLADLQTASSEKSINPRHILEITRDDLKLLVVDIAKGAAMVRGLSFKTGSASKPWVFSPDTQVSRGENSGGPK